MKFLRWVVGLAITVVIATFAVLNREVVPVVFTPFNASVMLPVYIPVLLGIAFGFIVGAFIVWISICSLRWREIKYKRKINALEKTLKNLKTEYPVVDAAPSMLPGKTVIAYDR